MKIEKTFFGILLLILLIVVFALRNAQTVMMDFWIWKIETSFSLVIIVSVILGAVASYLLSMPYRLKKGKQIREKDEKIEFLEKEILQLGKKAEKQEDQNDHSGDDLNSKSI